jgi:hypothetical protein
VEDIKKESTRTEQIGPTLSPELARKVGELGIDVNEVLDRVLPDLVAKDEPPKWEPSFSKLAWAAGFAVAASVAVAVCSLLSANDAREETAILRAYAAAEATRMNKMLAENLLVPKRLDELHHLRELSDPFYLDPSGRNRIAIACATGDLAAVVYWAERGTDLNQPRYDGRFVSVLGKNGGQRKVFVPLTEDGKTLFHRSPMMIAASNSHFHIIKYYLHPNRRDKIDWQYDANTGRSVLSCCKNKKQNLGDDAPHLLDEIILTLSSL